MTTLAKAALVKLLSLPVIDRLEVIERLVASIKADKAPSSPKDSADLSSYFGKVKGVFGDGLVYQKQIRDEW